MAVREYLEMGASPKRARAHVAKYLKFVFNIFQRLKERNIQKTGMLSGGEQQMLAVG
jgi:branched-chain amino acid transport system ATP-binding protein